MSVAYYIVPEREIEGFDHFVDGKALGHSNEKALKKLCEKLGVRPLMEFLGQDPAEFGEFSEDVAGEVAGVQWFDSSEGLATIRALLQYLAKNPKAMQNSSALVEDLHAYETVLARFEAEKVRWHLALDF